MEGLMGKSSIRPISGPFSMAMLNNKRVIIPLFPQKKWTQQITNVFLFNYPLGMKYGVLELLIYKWFSH